MVTINGAIIAMSWAVALYQDGEHYTLASHRDFECTQVANTWFVDPLIAQTVKEELDATQLDRHAEQPIIEKIRENRLTHPDIMAIVQGGIYSVFPDSST